LIFIAAFLGCSKPTVLNIKARMILFHVLNISPRFITGLVLLAWHMLMDVTIELKGFHIDTTYQYIFFLLLLSADVFHPIRLPALTGFSLFVGF
jgi:hypothetical protein